MTAVILDPFDPTRGFIAEATSNTWGIHRGDATLTNIHSATQCDGRPCVIHNPTDHHMRDWPLVWRGDKGVFERTCTHGTGHTDPDNQWFLTHVAHQPLIGRHGCDGCC